MGELSIYFGRDFKAHLSPSAHFDGIYTPEWLKDPLVVKIIEGVDNVKVNGEYSFIHPVYGNISPYMLSGGCKTTVLLQVMNPLSIVIDFSKFGSNCVEYVSEILEGKDLKCVCSTYQNSFHGYYIRGVCENDGTRFEDFREFHSKLIYWLEQDPVRNYPDGYFEEGDEEIEFLRSKFGWG